MIRIITLLTKAAAAVALAPVAAVADVFSLPASGYAGRPPFEFTQAMLKAAARAATEAVKP